MPILQFRNDTRITYNPSYEATILQGLQDSIEMFEALKAEAKTQADQVYYQEQLAVIKARIAGLRQKAVEKNVA